MAMHITKVNKKTAQKWIVTCSCHWKDQAASKTKAEAKATVHVIEKMANG